MEPLTVQAAIAELKKQRAEFAEQVANGQHLSQVAIDYIDGMLSQLE